MEDSMAENPFELEEAGQQVWSLTQAPSSAHLTVSMYLCSSRSNARGESWTPHLSKRPGDLKQNGTQEKTPFSGTVFHTGSFKNQ